MTASTPIHCHDGMFSVTFDPHLLLEITKAMRTLAAILAGFLAGYLPQALASKCSVAAEVRFDSAAAEVAVAQLPRINQAIELVERTNTVLAVLLVGHADLIEVPEKDQTALSLKRASRVADHILSAYPNLKGLVHVEGKGAAQPISKTEHGANRRVEMEVVCVVPPSTGLPAK